MEQINLEGLGAVQETLVIPLAMRALDCRSKKPILNDKLAEELYQKIRYDQEKFSPKKSPSYYGCLVRARYFDAEVVRQAEALHAAGKRFVTINAGCGLDTRGERIADRTYGARHFDMDFPNVIQVRQQLFKEGKDMIGGNLLDETWIKTIAAELDAETHVIVCIEGVFAYLNQTEIQQALTHLHEAFAGRCTVIFDALSRAWAKRSRQHDTLKHMEANFAEGVDSEADILRLVPSAHFIRKTPIIDLMAEVWWVAKLMRLNQKIRMNTSIFTFEL
jgi:tetracenomycin polyketide synthesis O-methyltransferase tcmP